MTRLLHMVGLEEFRRAYPYQLSGGMRRRVALLAGVAPLPKLLLLDEPFSALDEPTRVLIHREVQLLVKELEITAVLVTHDLSEAISLGASLHPDPQAGAPRFRARDPVRLSAGRSPDPRDD